MGKRKRRDEKLSITVPTLAHVAYFFSVTTSRVDNWRRAAEPMPGGDDDSCWDLKAIFEWWQGVYGGGGDEVSGANSPALEKLRHEKFLTARIDRQRKEGTLIDRDSVHEGLGVLAEMIRKTGERLERDFGIEAREAVDEMLDDYENYAERTWGDSSSEESTELESTDNAGRVAVDGEPVPSSSPADNK